MKTMWLVLLALPLMAASMPMPLLAASPPRALTLAVPADGNLSLPTSQSPAPVRGTASKPVYEPAPLPNRELSAPRAAAGPAETSLAPTLFTQREQYRGDGYSPGSTPQSEQERRLRPGAGFALHMPLQPQ